MGCSTSGLPPRPTQQESADSTALTGGNNAQNQVNNNHVPSKMNSVKEKMDTLTILHFNDVYNIEPRDIEPVGGAARMATLITSKNHLNPLVLFSGDALNPSLMSTVTKGQQMVPILNSLDVQCAVYGNHDFDCGVDELEDIAGQCNFPWLLSNCIDNHTGESLASGKVKHMIEWNGWKLGIMGLIEEEWIATLATIDPEEVTFIDFVAEGKKLAKELRDDGADFIIALTHMRWPNDRLLAENVDGIDIVLGGHDHDYNLEKINGKSVLKSGTDFQDISEITLRRKDDTLVVEDIKRLVIDSKIEEHPEVKQIVNKYLDIVQEKMEGSLGQIEVELDGRFSAVRTQETNLGNFVCDIMLHTTDADVALLNSGTLRSDRVHPKGEFKMKDLMAILPMIDTLVVIRIKGRQLLKALENGVSTYSSHLAGMTGKQIVEALENGVSQYPKLEGRFPQVSGITFGFDASKPSGKRVDYRFVRIQGEFLELEKDYRLVTKSYIALGKDGYDVFKDCEQIVNEENGPILSISVQNHFNSVNIVRGKKKARSQHRQSIINLCRRNSLSREGSLSSMTSLNKVSRSRPSLVKQASIHDLEVAEMEQAIAPKVDGRIFHLDDEKIAELLQMRRVVDRSLASLAIRESSLEEENAA